MLGSVILLKTEGGNILTLLNRKISQLWLLHRSWFLFLVCLYFSFSAHTSTFLFHIHIAASRFTWILLCATKVRLFRRIYSFLPCSTDVWPLTSSLINLRSISSASCPEQADGAKEPRAHGPGPELVSLTVTEPVVKCKIVTLIQMFILHVQCINNFPCTCTPRAFVHVTNLLGKSFSSSRQEVMTFCSSWASILREFTTFPLIFCRDGKKNRSWTVVCEVLCCRHVATALCWRWETLETWFLRHSKDIINYKDPEPKTRWKHRLKPINPLIWVNLIHQQAWKVVYSFLKCVFKQFLYLLHK